MTQRLVSIFGHWIAVILACVITVAAGHVLAADKVIRVMTTETDPKTQTVLREIIAEFEKANPGVRVNAEFANWSDINKKLLVSLAAGDPPQVVTVHDFYIFELADKGIIRPVDGLIDKIGRSDFFPVAIDGYTRNGHVWGVPFSIGQIVLWYRADLYEKYGLKAPTMWAEYEHNAKVLNEAGKVDGSQKFYGTVLAAGINWHAEDTIHNWMWNNGADITDANGKSALTSPETVETFEFLKRLSAYAPPGITTYGHEEVINAFATGAAAHTEYGYRLLNNLERMNPKLLETAVPILHPRGPSKNARGATHLYLKGWAILKDAKYQEETEAFLKYLETGDRKIRMMHTVPIHYWPPRKSIASDPKFLDNGLMETPAGQRALALVAKGFEQGVLALKGTGTVVPKIGPLIEGRVLSTALQRVLIKNVSPADSLGEASKAIE